MSALQFLFTLVFALFVNITSASFCNKIKEKYSPTERYVTQHGVPKNITIYWESDPARAAAAQLAVVLHHVLGYQHVQLQQATDHTPAETPCQKNGILKEVKIHMAAPKTQHRLYVHLTQHFRDKLVCNNIVKGTSYNDEALLSKCGFDVPSTSNHPVVHVIQMNIHIKTMRILATYLKAFLPRFEINVTHRKDLHRLLKTNQSFLFIDYDTWSDIPEVSTIELSQDLYGLSSLLRSEIITTVTDRCLVKEYAPQLLFTTNEYTPDPNSLWSILEIESSSKDIEEAACKQVTSKNFTLVNKLNDKYKPRKKMYVILSIICEDDPDIDEYYKLFYFLGVNRYKAIDSKFFIITKTMDVNCSDPDSVINDIKVHMVNNTSNLMGIVVGGVPNIADIAESIYFYDIPVLFYDANSIDATAVKAIATDEGTVEKSYTSSMWISTGRSLHITLALQHFVLKMGWDRIAVLSSSTPIAKVFVDDLLALHRLRVNDHRVRNNLTDTEAEKILHDLEPAGTKIIFVNTGYKEAVTILTAAVRLKMNIDDKYIWILREWRQNLKVLNITHFVISFWCKHAMDVRSTTSRRLEFLKKVDDLWLHHMWPPQTAEFINAVLTITEGFDEVIYKYPQVQDDTQSKQVIQQFERSLLEAPVQGITHTLKYKRHMLEEAMVFIDEWLPLMPKVGYRPNLLVQMRVNGTSRKVRIDYEINGAFFEQYQKEDPVFKISDNLWVVAIIIALLIFLACLLIYCFKKIYVDAKKLRTNRPKITRKLFDGSSYFQW